MRRSLVLIAVVAACAHAPDLPLRPDPAPPPGSTTYTFLAADGTQLLARRWAPLGDTRAVLVIMHGLKDYSSRYAAFAARAAAIGFAVYAFDLRGHGRSAGPRVAPRAWNDYVDDLDRFLSDIEKREPGKPVYVFGHSMGGAIATRAAEVHQPPVAGLILSGPALAIDAPPLLVAITKMSAALSPKAPALALSNKDFSSDPNNAAVMDKDELISQPAAPARTAGGLVAGIADIWRDIDRLKMPLLAMHGTADRLTAPAGSRLLVSHAPSPDKAVHIYEGYFHDLLHEPGDKGKRVEDDVATWLDAHASGKRVDQPPPFRDHLAGSPRGWTQVVDMAGGISDDAASNVHFAGRFALSLARPRPIGWYGALTALTADGHYSVALRPIGAAVHTQASAFGISLGGALRTNEVFALSGGAWFEHPLGPLHVTAFGDLDWRHTATGFFGGALRFGRDWHYWPRARAGVGPTIVGGAECAGTCGWFAMIGFQLFGAD
jgi:alpha-beta hydrolase superfamily lysophospholipase